MKNCIGSIDMDPTINLLGQVAALVGFLTWDSSLIWNTVIDMNIGTVLEYWNLLARVENEFEPRPGPQYKILVSFSGLFQNFWQPPP